MKLILTITLSVLLSYQVSSAQDFLPFDDRSEADDAVRNLKALQKQVDDAETLVNQAAGQLLAGTSDDGQVDASAIALTETLTGAVEMAFQKQLQLHKAQLADAEAKIAASREKIMQRQRNHDEIIALRVKSLLDVPDRYRSPQAALEAMERFSKEKDYDGLVSMLTDDGAELMAGMLLQSMTMMSSMNSLMEATGQPLEGLEQFMVQDTNRFMRPNPSPQATAAMVELASSLPQIFMQLGATSSGGTPLKAPSFTADEYVTRLRLASGVLTDVRAYSAAMMKAVSALEFNDDETQVVASDWRIDVDGERAAAKQQSLPVDKTACKTDSVELRIENGRWKISRIASDKELMEFAGVTTVSPATSPVTSSPYTPASPTNKSVESH